MSLYTQNFFIVISNGQIHHILVIQTNSKFSLSHLNISNLKASGVNLLKQLILQCKAQQKHGSAYVWEMTSLEETKAADGDLFSI